MSIDIQILNSENDEKKMVDVSKYPDKPVIMPLILKSFLTSTSTDITVIIGSKVYQCHLMLLQCFAKFFRREEVKILRKIELPHKIVTPGAFKMIYHWMLTTKPILQSNGIVELFMATQFLDITTLTQSCWNFMDDTNRYNEAEAFLLFLEAKKCNCESVKQLMVTRISKFFLVLVSSREFLHLSFEETNIFLKSTNVAVNSEIEILLSGIRWLTYKWDKRKHHFMDIFKCVRFTMMSPLHITGLTMNFLKKEPKVNIVIDTLMSTDVQRIVTNSIAYVIRLSSDPRVSYDKEYRLHCLNELHLGEERPRLIITHTENNIPQNTKNCANQISATYKDFLLYLKMLNKKPASYFKNFKVSPNHAL